MRIRSITARSEAEALQIVRRDMGPDAIIVSTARTANGLFEVTAAADRLAPPPPDAGNPIDIIGQALDAHATPRKLQDKIITLVERSEKDTAEEALIYAFAQMFQFQPLAKIPAKPLVLIGSPGVGKTVTIAKLAARSVAAGSKAIAITTDAERAGAIEQLEAFTRILQIDLLRARNLDSVRDAMLAVPPGLAVFVDTAGVNIWRQQESENLRQILEAIGTEPVFVYAAGGDAADAAEIAQGFGQLGAKTMLVTRLDMTRRYGSILAAAEAGNYQFSNVSISPHVADGLSTLSAETLARIYLPSLPYNEK
jgi:flagellar biosynthesis protein FlhF